MSRVGPLLFCTDCGNLLDPPKSDIAVNVKCDVCGTKCRAEPDTRSIVSVSKPTDYPSALRLKNSAVQSISAEDAQTYTKIDRVCERCGRKQMQYYTLQLRSADEGSTVFYVCECGFREILNN